MRRSVMLLSAALGLLLPGGARADGFLDAWHPHESLWSVGWEVAIPVNSLRSNWITRTSPAGGQFEVRVGLMERLSLGVAASYNWFDQTYSPITVSFPDTVVTGSVQRRFSAFNARGTLHYYLTSSRLQPFIGVGVGAVWTTARMQAADRVWTSYSSYLAVDPEAGFLLSTSDSFALYLLGRYQWTAASWDQVTNAQWVGVQIGFGWFF